MDLPTPEKDSIIKEMFAQLKRSPNTKQVQISIQEVIMNLISVLNSDNSDLSLVKNALEEMFYYYSDTEIQHDFDIIFQNIKILEALLHFAHSPDNDIRLYSLCIVLSLICLNDDIYEIFIREYNLFDEIKEILSNLNQGDEYFLKCIGIVLNILKAIFYRKDQANRELFFDKGVPDVLFGLFTEIKTTKFSDIEIQCIIDFFIAKSKDFNFNEEQFNQKYSPDIISPQRESEIISMASFQESIIYIFGRMYDSWGNVNDDMTTRIQQLMLEILEDGKKYLTYSISYCLNSIVKCNIFEFINIDLIEFLNGIFDYVDLQIFWSSIVALDLSIFQCISKSSDKSENLDKMLAIMNAPLIYDIIKNIADTKDDKQIEYQLKSIGLVLKLFTTIFNHKNDIIIENDVSSTDNNVLEIGKIIEILKIAESMDSPFYLLEKKFIFISTAIFTQDYCRTHMELVDFLFERYGENFIDLLESVSDSDKIMILKNLTDLAEVKSDLDTNIQNFLTSTDLMNLLEKWKVNEEEDVGNFSLALYEKISVFL